MPNAQLKYPTSPRSSKTHNAFQTIVSNRKSYKMLKGNTEAVWPPYLEEAMLKGKHGDIVFGF